MDIETLVPGWTVLLKAHAFLQIAFNIQSIDSHGRKGKRISIDNHIAPIGVFVCRTPFGRAHSLAARPDTCLVH